jgi:hypothetical protein
VSIALTIFILHNISPFQAKRKLDFLDQPASGRLGRDAVWLRKVTAFQFSFASWNELIHLHPSGLMNHRPLTCPPPRIATLQVLLGVDRVDYIKGIFQLPSGIHAL